MCIVCSCTTTHKSSHLSQVSFSSNSVVLGGLVVKVASRRADFSQAHALSLTIFSFSS